MCAQAKRRFAVFFPYYRPIAETALHVHAFNDMATGRGDRHFFFSSRRKAAQDQAAFAETLDNRLLRSRNLC